MSLILRVLLRVPVRSPSKARAVKPPKELPMATTPKVLL